MYYINPSEGGDCVVHLLNKSPAYQEKAQHYSGRVCVCMFAGEGGSGDGAGMRDNAGNNEEGRGTGVSI